MGVGCDFDNADDAYDHAGGEYTHTHTYDNNDDDYDEYGGQSIFIAMGDVVVAVADADRYVDVDVNNAVASGLATVLMALMVIRTMLTVILMVMTVMIMIIIIL